MKLRLVCPPSDRWRPLAFSVRKDSSRKKHLSSFRPSRLRAAWTINKDSFKVRTSLTLLISVVKKTKSFQICLCPKWIHFGQSPWYWCSKQGYSPRSQHGPNIFDQVPPRCKYIWFQYKLENSWRNGPLLAMLYILEHSEVSEIGKGPR